MDTIQHALAVQVTTMGLADGNLGRLGLHQRHVTFGLVGEHVC